MDDGERRRRRVRGTRQPAPPTPPVDASQSSSPSPTPTPRPPAFTATTAEVFDDQPTGEHPIIDHPVSAHDREDRDERSLRGLIGGGSSQVNVSAAMRARDASRPTDADIAHAEATLNIVHRGWVPRDG